MKYFILGATIVASYPLSAMNHAEKSFLMPIIRTTAVAKELVEHSRCDKGLVCRYSIEDEKLSLSMRYKIDILRAVFRKTYSAYNALTSAELDNVSSDFHISLAWLSLLSGKRRDCAVAELTEWSVLKGSKEFIEFLERHGFKANHIPAPALKALEKEAAKHQSRKFSSYVSSLKNPREFNIEECVNQ